MDAVAATDAGREFVFFRAARDDRQKLFHVGNQDVRTLHHLHRKRGVADIAARQAEMQPAAGLVVDFFRNRSGETDDIVVECFLQFFRAFSERFCVGETFFRAAFHLREIGARHDALLHQRFTSEEFDLQPDAELVFVRPDGAHFGARVA